MKIPGRVAGEVLRHFIERVERLSEEIKSLNDDKSEVFKEARAQGFDTKAMKTVIKIRAMDADDRAEQEAIVETYLRALGQRGAGLDKAEEPEHARVHAEDLA